MKSVQVYFHVKEACTDEFIEQTLINVENSKKESGVKHFLFFQQTGEPHSFCLIEVYQTVADQLKHRETAHYIHWKEKIAPMLENPYQITELTYM